MVTIMVHILSLTFSSLMCLSLCKESNRTYPPHKPPKTNIKKGQPKLWLEHTGYAFWWIVYYARLGVQIHSLKAQMGWIQILTSSDKEWETIRNTIFYCLWKYYGMQQTQILAFQMCIAFGSLTWRFKGGECDCKCMISYFRYISNF